MTHQDPSRVDAGDGVACYRDGARAFVVVAGRFAADDWGRPSACEGWSAGDLVAHVRAVVEWHHEWLERAERGDSSAPWPAAELAARNDATLTAARRCATAAPDLVAAFSVDAARYADRLPSAWELPYGMPAGTVTAGVHAVLAAGEWQLHAWDLGVAIGHEHRGDGELVRQVWRNLGRPVSAEGDAWEALLVATGRRP